MQILPVFKSLYYNNTNIKPFKNSNLKKWEICDTISFSGEKSTSENKNDNMDYTQQWMSNILNAEESKKASAINAFNNFMEESDVFFDDELLYIAQTMLKIATEEQNKDVIASCLEVVKTIATNYDCGKKIDFTLLKEGYSNLSDEKSIQLANELLTNDN